MDSTLPPPQNISSAEIENILAQAAPASGNFAESLGQKGGSPAKVPSQVFRQLSSASSGDLRKFRLRQEDFIHTLSSRLGMHFRLEIGLKMSLLDIMTYKKFVGELSNPTHLVLLKLEPLPGMCLLDIPSQLGLSIVDRELGGKGVCSENERALTEIEVRILNKFIETLTREWCSSWKDMLDLRAVPIGYESSTSYVQGFSIDTPMLVLGIEMQIGELTREMHLAVPYPTVDPLIKKLNASGPGAEEHAEKRTPAGPRWNPALDDMNLRLSAKIPNLQITAREVANLKAGDVIPLDPEILQQLRLSLGEKPKFLATIGRCGPRWAAKITKVLDR